MIKINISTPRISQATKNQEQEREKAYNLIHQEKYVSIVDLLGERVGLTALVGVVGLDAILMV